STGGTTPVLTVFLAYLVISDAILIKLMGPDPRHSGMSCFIEPECTAISSGIDPARNVAFYAWHLRFEQTFIRLAQSHQIRLSAYQ
ncbi:hypothetical protein ACLBWS_18045, partial [Brucellaceae bacterium D45D]